MFTAFSLLPAKRNALQDLLNLRRRGLKNQNQEDPTPGKGVNKLGQGIASLCDITEG